MNQMHNFFKNANAGSPFGNVIKMVQMLGEFANNPFGALMSMGYNIPQQLQNNPEGMVNYLRSTGQMGDQQFNQYSNDAMSFMNKYGNQIANMFGSMFRRPFR